MKPSTTAILHNIPIKKSFNVLFDHANMCFSVGGEYFEEITSKLVVECTSWYGMVL